MDFVMTLMLFLNNSKCCRMAEINLNNGHIMIIYTYMKPEGHYPGVWSCIPFKLKGFENHSIFPI